MADKIILGEVDIDMEKTLADTIELKKRIGSLMAQMKEAKSATGENSAEYIQLSASLKASKDELRTHENILNKVTLAETTNIGTIAKLEAQNSALRAEQKRLNLETKEGVARNKEIVDQINKNTTAIKNNSDEQKKGWMNVGQYSASIKDAASSLTSMIPEATQASAALRVLQVIFKTLLGPVGLVIAALGTLISYFKRSEEGQNSLNKIIAIFKGILGGIMDVIDNVGKAIYNAATKPKEAWQSFKDFIKGVGTFFQNTFGNVIGGSVEVFVGFLQKAFANIGLAWQKLKGIFVDNTEGINEAQAKINEYDDKIKEGQNKVKEGVENLKEGIVNAYNKAKDAVVDFYNNEEKKAKKSAELADMKDKLNKQIRNEKIEEAKRDKEIAEFRADAANKDKMTGEERLKLLNQAIDLENKNMDAELSIAKQKAYIHSEEMKLSHSKEEDYEEQAQLEADIFKIEQQNAEKRRGFERQRQSAINDMIADQQKAAESAVDQMNYEVEQWKILNRSKLKEAQENNRMLTDSDIEAEKKRLAMQASLEEAALKKQLEVKISEIDAKENESEAAKNAEKLKLQEDYNNAVLEKEQDLIDAKHQLDVDFKEQERQRHYDNAVTDYENQLSIYESNISKQYEIQQNYNKLKKAEEIRNAEKTGASIKLIEEKYAKADEKLERAKRDAKLALAQDAAKNLETIFGESTAVGKAAAVAMTTIETYRGAQAAYTGMIEAVPGPIGIGLGIIAAAAATAEGIANVKKILAVSTSGSSSVSSDSGSASSATAPTGYTTSMTSTQTSIGNGIVSRDTASGSISASSQTTVLVVDDVTEAQKIETQKTKTSTL